MTDGAAGDLSQEVLLGIIGIQTEVVQQGLDLGGVMALVSERIGTLLGTDGAVVELVEGDDMVYRAASGIAAPQLGLRIPRIGSLSGLCIEQSVPLVCDDSELDGRVDRDACRRVGLRSMIVMPLQHGGRAVGVLKILATRPAAFSGKELRAMELISDLIAAAMSHAAQYQADELFRRATHDTLTGLANRALFYDRLRTRIAQAGRDGSAFAVLVLDMDGLKQINDTLGHGAGDSALKELASRIRISIRDEDTPARIGGDEFAVLLPGVRIRRDADAARRRLERRIGFPFYSGKRRLRIGASIGCAFYPEDGVDIDGLLEKADQAMYEEKRRRKGEDAGVER